MFLSQNSDSVPWHVHICPCAAILQFLDPLISPGPLFRIFFFFFLLYGEFQTLVHLWQPDFILELVIAMLVVHSDHIFKWALLPSVVPNKPMLYLTTPVPLVQDCLSSDWGLVQCGLIDMTDGVFIFQETPVLQIRKQMLIFSPTSIISLFSSSFIFFSACKFSRHYQCQQQKGLLDRLMDLVAEQL